MPIGSKFCCCWIKELEDLSEAVLWITLVLMRIQHYRSMPIQLKRIYIFLNKNLQYEYPWALIKDVLATREPDSPQREHPAIKNNGYCTGTFPVYVFTFYFILVIFPEESKIFMGARRWQKANFILLSQKKLNLDTDKNPE
jgi:hypothetical protein